MSAAAQMRTCAARDPDPCRSRSPVFADIKTQFNVIVALTIRELQSLMKSYNYGFAWALLEPIMFIGIMRVARSAFKGLTPPDMPPTTFLIVGIIPFYSYIAIITAAYGAVSES